MCHFLMCLKSQGLDCMMSGKGVQVTALFFIFKSDLLLLTRGATCVWETKTNTPDESINILHCLCLVILDSFRSF